MTDQQLHDSILADPAAKALADAGDDAGCAARLATALPPALATTYVNERGIYAAFPDPTDALAVMSALADLAAGDAAADPPIPANPIVARSLTWLEPNNGGIDVSNAAVRAMLDRMTAPAGATPARGQIVPAQASTLKALAEWPASVDPAQVSRAWLRYRPNGQITGLPS